MSFYSSFGEGRLHDFGGKGTGGPNDISTAAKAVRCGFVWVDLDSRAASAQS